MESKSAVRKPDRALIAILLAFVVLALGYSLTTRLKHGPDEPAHFIYIRSIATSFALPPIAHTETHTEHSASTHEGHQPPLYYAIMAVPYAALDFAGLPPEAIWRVLRLLNIALGVLWICAVYALSLTFFGRRDYALASTGFVALIPTSSYTVSVLNNEVCISLFFTSAMIPMLAYFRSGVMSNRSGVMLGLLMGLAILSKAQGLILVPLLLLAALLVSRRRHYANWSQVLRQIGVALGVAMIVSGWWFARNMVVHGAAMPHSLHNPVLLTGLMDVLVLPLKALTLAFIFTKLLFGYFWTPFWLAWPYVDFRIYVAPLALANVVMLVGLAGSLRRLGSEERSSFGYLLAAFLLTYLSWLRYVMVVDAKANMQGRLLLPVAAVVGVMWVLAFDRLLPGARAKRIGAVTGALVLLLMNAGMIGCAVATYWLK